MRPRTLGMLSALAITMTACGDDGGTATTRVSSTAAPTTVAAASTTVVASSTAAPTTAAASSTAAPTTTSAPSTTALPQGLPNRQALAAGTTYRVPRNVIGRSMQITTPADGTSYAGFAPGGLALTTDSDLTFPLLGVVDPAAFVVFEDPYADLGDLDGATVDALPAGPVPADYLAWFAGLPGMEAGEITDTEFAGFPARAMTWKVASVDGGAPCSPSVPGNCLVTLYLPGSYFSSYWAGDSGTTYVLDVEGRPIIVEVQDRPGAQEAADSLAIGA